MRWTFATSGVLFAAQLAWGLKTGAMPASGIDRLRQENPVQFWMISATYAALSLGGFYGALFAP